MSFPPPHVPDARLDSGGWRLVEDATATPYDGVVTVVTRTLVYEDAGLRARLRDAAGVDRSVRFFLGSRVRVSPLPVPASLLRTRVARESADSFVTRLRDAGMRGVRERDAGGRTLGGARAFAVEYAGTVTVGDAVLDVAARIAARTVRREFVVTGGAFPTGVRGDGEAAAALSGLFDPASYRAELAALMRDTDLTDPAERRGP